MTDDGKRLWGVLGWSLGLAAALAWTLAAPPAAAQSIDVQSIEAVVNDQVVSAYDVDQRLSLILASVNAEVTPEQKQFLRRQAMQNLIDEKLQIQEAENFDVIISDAEVDETLTAIGQQYRMTPQQFDAYLKRAGASLDALRSQVRAEIAWSRLVRGRYRQQITVGDEEVQAVLDKLQQSQGQSEYLLSEIFLIVDVPARAAEVRANAERLVEQLRGGAPFQVVARQFSEAATAAGGGDLGWVPQGQLAEEVVKALGGMRANQISDPIETPGGYYIMLLRDRRKILDADPADTQLSLHQYLFESAAGETMEAAMSRAARATQSISSCQNLPEPATLGAKEGGRLGVMRLGDLPPDAQERLERLEVGRAAAPFPVPNGARVLVLCERTVPEVRVPTFDAVSESLTQQRLSLMARRYLRDLRRDAIIDYR
jgi:peptidyl-prolyl cis-trans isomerase SurA